MLVLAIGHGGWFCIPLNCPTVEHFSSHGITTLGCWDYPDNEDIFILQGNPIQKLMMSRHGNRFPITGPLRVEFISDQNAELCWFLRLYSVSAGCTKASSLLSQDLISSLCNTENMGSNYVNSFVTGGKGGHVQMVCSLGRFYLTLFLRIFVLLRKLRNLVYEATIAHSAKIRTIGCIFENSTQTVLVYPQILLIHYIFLPCKTIDDVLERHFWSLSNASEHFYLLICASLFEESASYSFL